MKLYDATNTLLGNVSSVTRAAVVVITATGHFVTINWTGDSPAGQIYYSDGACTTNPILNTGGRHSRISGKTVVWSHSLNSYMVPSNVAGDGTAASIEMMAGSIDNPACGPYSVANPSVGWRLRPVSTQEIGLPPSIVLPLTLQ